MPTHLSRGPADYVGLPGRTVIALTVAGGVLAGGVLVAMVESLSEATLAFSSTGLFLIGSVVGGVHGTVLGYLGRELDSGTNRALLSEARSLLYAFPALAVAWPLSSWIAISTGTTSLVLRVLSGLSWIAVAGFLLWSAWIVANALRNAGVRWPERRAGIVVLLLVLAAVGVLLLNGSPELWGRRLRWSRVESGLIAATGALWLVVPLVVLGLHAARRTGLGLPWSADDRPGSVWTNRASVIGGLGALVIVALILPFRHDPLAIPWPRAGDGLQRLSLLLASRVVLDEVVLRLGVLSTIFWLMVRFGRLGRRGAALVAVTVAAGLEVGLSAPGAIAYGFRSDPAMIQYLVAGVFLPALVLGIVYVRVGLTISVLAHTSALIAVVLIASI